MGQRWDKVRGTTSSVFGIGNGRSGDKSLQALVRTLGPPEIKWDDAEGRWKYSLDGSLFLGLGEHLLPIQTTGSGAGDFGYVAPDGTFQKTDASVTSKSRCVGVNIGLSGFVLTAGVVTIAKFSPLSVTPVLGKAVFLARADDEGGEASAGKLTARPPTTGVIAKVGLVLEVDANFLITRQGKVLLQIEDITKRAH
jgi:hypothetical protein